RSPRNRPPTTARAGPTATSCSPTAASASRRRSRRASGCRLLRRLWLGSSTYLLTLHLVAPSTYVPRCVAYREGDGVWSVRSLGFGLVAAVVLLACFCLPACLLAERA